MMDSITFIVPGRAAPKKRPRVVLQKGRIHTYTPDPDGFAGRVQAAVVRVAGGRRLFWEGPVTLSFLVLRPMPISWSKRKRNSLVRGPCTSQPDTLNIAMALGDAMTRLVYKDDSQVFLGSCLQRWDIAAATIVNVAKGEPPCSIT